MENLIREFLEGEVLPFEIVAVRLVGACVLCALIGLEREWTRHPAGLRTHMLVGIATCIFSLLTLSIMDMYESGQGTTPGNVTLDPLRVLQAIGAAIAFIAAGVVVFSEGKLKGLTTSATIWVASGIGIAAGLGLWGTASLATLLTVIVNWLLKPIGELIGKSE
jgi:putative Mg2+ transporter-C (MgtC) family protein